MQVEPGYLTLSMRAYVAMLASLVLIGTPPLFFWLAEQHVLPWRDEASWIRARERVAELNNPGVVALLSRASIELERRCFGACPDYRVTVWGTGLVVFEGLRYTCAPGIHTARIDQRLAIDLITDLHVSRFRELWWEPNRAISDAPTAIIRFSLLVPPTVQEHYLGDVNAPRVLFDMERTIDEVADTRRWLPQDEKGVRLCISEDGTHRTPPKL
jgi:hypothetical protein